MSLNNLVRILIIWCSLCWISPAIAEPLSKSVKVVMDNNYPPFVFQDSKGDLQGILIDQWKLWERKAGIKVEISAMDWWQAISRMKNGEFDVIDTVFQTEERTGWLDFTQPYAKIEVPIFFDKEISGITNAASLKGFVVAAKTGDAAIDLLKRSGVETLVLYNSYEAVILAAKEHKVTAFVVDKPPALYFLHKLGIQEHYKQSVPLNVGHFHRAVKKGNSALLKTVEDGFGLISAGEIEDIDKKWYGSSLGNDIPVGSILAGFGALCLLLLLLLIWNVTLKKAVIKRTTELKASEERLRIIFETSESGIILVSPQGVIDYANWRMAEMFGMPHDELIGSAYSDHLHE